MHKSQVEICVCIHIYIKKTYAYDYIHIFMEQKTLLASSEPQQGMQTNVESHATGIKFDSECTTKHHRSATASSSSRFQGRKRSYPVSDWSLWQS